MANEEKKKAYQEAIQNINRTGQVSTTQTSTPSTQKTSGNVFTQLISALTNKTQNKQAIQEINRTGRTTTSASNVPDVSKPSVPTNSYTPSNTQSVKPENTSIAQNNQNTTSFQPTETRTRESFNNDHDYENYLVENKTDFTKGDAFNYLKEKAKAEGVTSRQYLEGIRTRYKNSKETSKIEEQARNGIYTEDQLAELNNRYNVLLDENGNVADLTKYNNDSGLVSKNAEEIQKKIEKNNQDYLNGKIDYETAQVENNRLVSMWNENSANAEKLGKYTYLQGFDYYDWAKSNNMDVTDFEAYTENINDNMVERLAQAYGASWWDTIALRADEVGLARMIFEPSYDFNSDENVSAQMRQTAEELREYARAGLRENHLGKWTLDATTSLMPMINEQMIAGLLPLEEIAQLRAGNSVMTEAELAKAVGKLSEGVVNANLGVQSGVETARRRLEEGNNGLTAGIDGVLHGTITAVVEGMDMGSTFSLFKNGVGKYMASLPLLGKPSVLKTLAGMAWQGHTEGMEEIDESILDFVADHTLNAISDLTNALGPDALQRVQVDPLNPQDLATQYALAFYGTAILGTPASIGNFIDSKYKYDATQKSVDHFESVLADPRAEKAEKALAQISLENAKFAMETSPVAKSDLAQAVDKAGDNAEPMPTYAEMMDYLVEAERATVREDLERVNNTIKYSEQLRNNLAEALNARGVNVTVDQFMDAKNKGELVQSSPIFNDAGVGHVFTRMKKGINGVNLDGMSFINTDQSTTLDPYKVADLDSRTLDEMLEKDPDMVFAQKNAGELSTLLTSGFHEGTHGLEGTKAYDNLRKMAIDELGEDRYENLKRNVEKIYKKLDLPVDNPESEALAYYYQKNLNSPDFIKKMATYNQSFLDRLFYKITAVLKGDAKAKMQNMWLDAVREAQKTRRNSLVPQYSVGSLFQAIGMTIHKESETVNDDGGVIATRFYATDKDNNIIRKVTPEMVKNSPLGAMLNEAQKRGFVESASSQEEMVATIYNSILKTQDPELFWAIFGSIGFERARVGTSSYDVGQAKKFASFTKNSDPQYGHTFDVTTICTKTQQLIDVASETMKRLGRGLTEDEVINIVYDEVFKAGEPVPCPVCYVFARWVGVGGVLENIKNFQEKYKNANVNEIRDRYEVLTKKVDEIVKTRTDDKGKKLRNSDAQELLREETDKEITRRYDELYRKGVVERMGGDHLTAEERTEFESLKKDLEILNDWAWISKVILKDSKKNGVRTIEIRDDWQNNVPDEILFDLNKGEDFSKYPAWRYRASRGQAYGKIIAPYSDMVLGQTVLGFASPSSIDTLGSKRDAKTNVLLDMSKTDEQEKLYDVAVRNAKEQNLKNGSRAQSTSDFRFEYITDYILHFLQLQSIGSCGQTYTKVPEAVPVLCSVGYEVNMSLMPKGKGYKPAKEGDPYAYYVKGIKGAEDGWYTIDCSSVTGINPESAFYLREQYDNAQTIMVGINAVHMYLCMQDPRIDFIIPYHASGGSNERYNSMMTAVGENEQLREIDRIDYSTVSNENEKRLSNLTEDQIYAYELRDRILTQDIPNPTESEKAFMQKGTGILWSLWNRFYVEGVDNRCREEYKVKNEDGSEETKTRPLAMSYEGSGASKHHAIYPYEYWDEASTRETADENGKRYVAYCKELGFQPKFENLANGDGGGGYWKVLPDRSMYNVDGTSHIQKPINMDNFSSDFLFKGNIQEGIVGPLAEQEGIITDKNDPYYNEETYKEFAMRVLSQQFDKTKTEPIVENVVSRCTKDPQFCAGGQTAIMNLLKNGSEEDITRALGLAGQYFKAQRLISEGKSSREVFQETGWAVGKDGRLRFQFWDGVDEANKRLVKVLADRLVDMEDEYGGQTLPSFIKRVTLPNKSILDENRTMLRSDPIKFTEILGNDNVLFRMYPDFKNRNVYFYFNYSDDERLTGGYFDHSDGNIYINLGKFYLYSYMNEDALASEYRPEADDPENFIYNFDSNDSKDVNELGETFFHELQHAIQTEEGFEGGTSPEWVKINYVKQQLEPLDAREKEIENKLEEIGFEYDPIAERDGDPDNDVGFDVGYDAMLELMAYNDYKKIVKRDGKQGKFATREYYEEKYSHYPQEVLDLLDEYMSIEDEKEQIGKNVDEDIAHLLYRDTLGEKEARDQGQKAVGLRPKETMPPVATGRVWGDVNTGTPYSIKFSAGPEINSDGNGPIHVDGEIMDGYGEKRNQRFATSNIPKSNIFDNEQKAQIDAEVDEGLFTYLGTYNDVEVQRAREWLERDGIDKTYNTVMENDHPDAKHVIRGMVLMQELSKAKDPRWHDVAVKLADDATVAGQFLQAYAIMQRLSPEGQLMAVKRSMRRLQQRLDNKYGNRAPKLEIGTELEEELRNAKNPEEMERVREKIREHLEQQVPLTFRDQINAWRYLAMLGNPRTHARNILGNAIFVPAITIKNAIGTVLERTASENFKKKYGMDTNTKAVLNRLSETDQALLKKGREEYELYKGAIEKGQKKYEKKSFSENNPVGRFFNKLSNWNSKAMDTEDFWFTSARFASSYAQYVKSNGMTAEDVTPKVNAKAVAYAIREAFRATYRDANAVADWLNELEYSDKNGLKMASYVKDALVPFTKTPMNIVKRGVRYSPIGLIYTVTHDYADLRNGKITANDYLDNLAQGLTGTSIALLGALLKSIGMFRTKDDDKDRKQYFDSENGEQDYALDFRNWGGGTYTVDWATPVIMPFAIGAELYDIFKDFEGTDLVADGWSAVNAVADISAKIMDPIMETSMLSSLQDALKSYSSEGGAWLGEMVTSMASSYIQQMFPTLGGQLARTIDDTRRTTYPNNGKIDKTIKQIMNKIPWLSTYNEPYINRQGQEEKTEDLGLGDLGMGFIGRAFLNMVSPGYYSSKDVDEYDEELYRLYDETDELDVFPSSSSSSVTFDKIPMKFTSKEYTEWHKMRWQTETEYVNQFIDSEAYKRLSDEERVATIKDIRSYAQMVAKKQFLESRGYTYVDDKDEYEERYAKGEKVVYEKGLTNANGALDQGIDLYAYFDYLNNSGSKQADKMAYLEASNLTEAQKEYLWNLNGYKTSYKDYKNGGKSKSKSSSSGSKKKKGSASTARPSVSSPSKASAGGSVNTSRRNLISSGAGKVNLGNYLSAYSNSMRRNYSKPASGAGGSTTVCPKCGNKVPYGTNRCPVCGTRLG